VYKVHHSLADGIALVLLMCNMVDKLDANQIPKVIPRMSLIQKIGLNLLYPIFFHHWYTIESLFLLPTQTNYITRSAAGK
jgi:hypothetical protein